MFKRSSKVTCVLYAVLITLFCLSISVALIGRGLCVRDNIRYAEKQDEIFVIEEIAKVLQSEEGEPVYVCYNDASCVNVYTASGEFMWAVSTPYMRNVYFEIKDGQFILYNLDDAYLYDALSGDFIEKTDVESLDLSYDWETERLPVDEMASGTICFDTYQVYRVGEDGGLTTIVERPNWYWIFNFGLCWAIGFGSGIMIGILVLINKIKRTKAERTQKGGQHERNL